MRQSLGKHLLVKFFMGEKIQPDYFICCALKRIVRDKVPEVEAWSFIPVGPESKIARLAGERFLVCLEMSQCFKWTYAALIKSTRVLSLQLLTKKDQFRVEHENMTRNMNSRNETMVMKCWKCHGWNRKFSQSRIFTMMACLSSKWWKEKSRIFKSMGIKTL